MTPSVPINSTRLWLVLPAALALQVLPASSAVRQCEPLLSATAAVARTEIEARRQSLQDWLAKAKQIGPGYTRWELAYNRRIECQKAASGGFQCQATAMPCTIKQVPAPDLQPLKRGQ